ncbi:matrixin family metalloprotease [Novipirellula sp. SH528]|uniref:matrixin family metalloprotease n=1 Tax=Novipirellula sp. SH528 TaxID=3454466 RepID=UPI003F9EF091
MNLFRNRTNRPLVRKKRRRLMAEPLEARRVLAASLGWDGPGLGGAELTYTVSNAPSSLSQAEVDAAIQTALDAWASVVDVTFTKVDQTGLRDSIDIEFTNIDGGGGTLAQAYFPDDVNPDRIAGDIQFDSSDIWEVGNSLGNQAFDLVWVAAHEIGHSLGLDHLGDVGSVLQAFVSPNQQFGGLGASDISEALGLYAAAVVGDVDDTTTTEDAPVDEAPADESTNNDDTDPENTDPGNTDPTNGDPDDTGDTNDNPFPFWRWRRGGHWHRWGGRLDADVPDAHNLYNSTDTNNDGLTSALDALVVINQLSHTTDVTISFSDVNGDGNITALDALMVINSLPQTETTVVSQPVVSQIVVDVNQDDSLDDGSESDDANTLTEEEPDVSNTDVSNTDDSVVDDNDVEMTDETDPVDESEETADDDTTDTVDDSDDDLDPIDDGGLTNEDDDSSRCDDGHAFGSPRRPHGFGHIPITRIDASGLLNRFDANDDGSLSEDELPESLWTRLIDKDLDADADGVITSEEIELFASTKRAERFASKDNNSDGVLSEDEVFARYWQKLSAADSNEDGGISLEEFESWIDSRDQTAAEMQPETVPASALAISRNFDSIFTQLGRRGRRG